jgi:hypothetical protein
MLNAKNTDMHALPSISAVEPVNHFDLPFDVSRELQRARQIIDDEVNRIMSIFPEGRKNSLFKIRFGTLEEIKTMEIQAIFKLLKLGNKCANLNRLQKINYHGEKVS